MLRLENPYLSPGFDPPADDRSDLVGRDEPGPCSAPPHQRDGRVVEGVNPDAPVLSPVVDVDVAVLPPDAEQGVDRMPL